MTTSTRTTILGVLLIFMSGVVFAAPRPTATSHKAPYGLLAQLPASVARLLPNPLPKIHTAQVPLVGKTVQWTGTVNTDWSNPGNWITISGTPNIPPQKGSINGDHVIIPNVSAGSGNYPVVMTGTVGARSITLQAGASLTVNAGATLEVEGSDTDGFVNAGIFTNKGSTKVDSAYNDAFVNQLNAQIINEGSINLLNGLGNRLINHGSITNTSGAFYVNQGVDTAFINYATGSVLNNATFTVSGGNNVRLYNLGNITNKSAFTVGGATAGNGFINGKNATLTNEGNFQVNGGSGSQMLNYGLIDNLAGTFQLSGGGGGSLTLFHNTRRVFNKTGATISLGGGGGTMLRNDSIVINEGTFTVQGGAGANPLVLNNAGDTIRNKGPFTISGGQGHSLLNYGVFENLANTLRIQGGGDTFDQLHNKFRVLNELGATIHISGGQGHSIRNDSILINNGTVAIDGGGFDPSIYNGVGDTILTKGSFVSGGGGTFISNPNRAALDNFGYIEFHNNFHITSRYNKLIRNAGEIIGKATGNLKLNNSGDIQLHNQPTGKVILAGASEFLYGARSAIRNEGYFKQVTGTFNTGYFYHAIITNLNYLELDVNITATYRTDSFLVNKDTLIFGPNMQVNVQGVRVLIYNTGYLLNQADLYITQVGHVLVRNAGTFINEANASIAGAQLPSGSPSINNEAGGKFFNKGEIRLFKGGGVALQNAGTWANTGKLQIGDFNGYNDIYNAIVNTDTLLNDGTIELDTLYNQGIDNSKYLRNGRDGKIYADFVRKNGIYNLGDVYNFGEIWMARDTGIGEAGIYNAKLFDNCGVINIGEKGPVFGGGIVNVGAGVFNNRPTSHIVIDNVDSLSIRNVGIAFNNGLCALIEVATPIQDLSNTFSNHGIIVQGQDTLTLDADITTNTGTVYDLDPENFVITNNTGQVLNSLPDGGVTPASITFTVATPEVCDGDTAKFVVEASCPAGPFDLVISYNGTDQLIEDYVSGDTIKIAGITGDTIDFVLKSIDVDGLGQVEKEIPAVQITTYECTPPEVSISDPCTCVNNSPSIPNGTTTNAGTFSETITIQAPSGQTWTIIAVSGLYSDEDATTPYTVGTTIPETGAGTKVYELFGYHLDATGYTIEVTNNRGDTLSVGNTCYYPDPVFTGLPAVVSPNAAPFTVTGTVANNAAGTGTFILNGTPQAGASPAPTTLTINPATLGAGTHTLAYSFDAGIPEGNNPNDPGCVQEVTQSFRVANCSCQEVTVSLDANCQFNLTANQVSDGNCAGATVRVMDNNPGNGNLIDCAGVWTYGLFDSFGNILCWGKVTAEDKTAPALVCAPPDFTLDCYDVNYVLNNRLTIGNVKTTSSPRPSATSNQTILNAEGVTGTGDNCQLGLAPPALVADNILNLGYAYFRDNCYTCGCRITLKWHDKVGFYSCEQMRTNGGYYAKIEREWVATDCNGMSSSYVQDIFFTRPDLDDFVFNGPGDGGKYDRVVEYNSCTADKSLIKKEDVTPYICSYFNSSANPRCLFIDQVECNYSISIKDTEFPICGGKGVKIDREIYVFDWCAGGIVDTFHVLIKIGDFQAPTIEYAHGAPYDISTGPMDCTASIPVTAAGIKSTFGVSINDNCTLGNIGVSVYTKDRYVKGILVYEGPDNPFCIMAKGPELRGDHDAYQLGACNKDQICWDKIDYAVMNGMMIGLPVGRHLMVIDAFDGCYNTSTTCFIFDVKDKIAPVMKCDDDLHVTLSNANGYTTGYAQVSVDDIDEGSWDNCKLAWLAARRNVPDGCVASFIAKGYDTNGNGKLDALPADGDYTKADGFDRNGDGDIADFGETFILKGGKLMTPLADFVEFFCCDLAERVTVELWGEDIYGNTNYCWMDLLIEDKVAPTCIAPWDVTIYCDDKNIAQIDDKVASGKIFGDITIPTGNDCAALDTVYSTIKSFKCGYGYIDRIWTLTKQTAKGPISITCKQRINILPVHEYNICFPKDVSTDCKTPVIDTVVNDELACDILAVNVSDKRYDASDDECYKIFRTYTVINWCVYDDRCGDPMAEGNVYVVDRATFGNYGKAPLYVLVRDREGNVRDGNEEFYLSKDLIAANADDIRFTPPICYPEGPKFKEDGLIPEPTGEYYHSFMYTQIIKVYDDVRPVVTGPAAEFCIRESSDCLANIKMVVSATDNCTDSIELETQYLMIAPNQTTDAGKMILYSTPRWSTKALGGGQFEINVANLPEGTHDLIVVVRDECGNLSVATRIPFTVKDCKGPAPICINGLGTELMPDGNNGGMMTVWASDFIASKVYDCNGQGPETLNGLKLVTKYSINRVGQPVNQNQTSLTVNCADKNRLVVVEVHAWDEKGNHDFCLTYVEVQDGRKICPGSATGEVSIAGTISTEGAGNLQGASITLSGAASQSANTSAIGGYSFINLTKGGDFTVTPQLDKNHLNGVSTFDLVLIQKHILGVQALNSPYKMIAADVNNSKSISTLDLIALRKLILNIDSHFANNTSWRFVDAAYNFPTPSNPWSANFPEVVSVNDIANDVTANFIAIKVGDVNASASVNGAASAEIRTNSDFELKTQEQQLKAGNEYKIAFAAEDLQHIQGYQFALNLDQSKVELVDLIYGVAKAENFGIFKNEGLITTSWNAKYESGALFTLMLRAKADSKLSTALSLNRLVHPEAYDQQNENLGIKLAFVGEQISDSYELKQNVPNPFSNETNIGFTLPKAMKGTLTVRDVKGALIYKVEGNYTKGNNQVNLKKEQLGASGVLYYTLETNDFTATKKMIILQ